MEFGSGNGWDIKSGLSEVNLDLISKYNGCMWDKSDI